MEIKKKFKLVQDREEETFLNEQSKQGYQLVSLSNNTYVFEEKNTVNFY